MTSRRLQFPVLVAWLFALVLAVPHVPTARAGLTDKLKKKAEQEANKAANDALKKTPAAQEAEAESTPATTTESAAADETQVSAVSTKFDYVPGDKVLFYDDFTQDPLGEFPTNWKLKTGTFEVAEMKGQRWMRCTSTDSDISMKLPPMPTLPEYWTLEFDFFCSEASGNVLNVFGKNGDTEVWVATFPYSGNSLMFRSGEVSAVTPLEGGEVWGRTHHVMFMARGTGLKVYIDRQRMASVPEINAAPGAPTTLSYRLWSDKGPMITNVRFAEGNKPIADPFANGKLVTYGIYFDSGSDVVKGESAPVLRQIAAYMEKDAAVKVEIDGHTDNVGAAASNLDLSKRRAASVAKVLSEQFKIASERFKIDGMGDTKPVAGNDKPEGRAMNRRVEFSKL